MTNEIEIGLEFVNERLGTSYTNPEDVLKDCEDLAAQLVAGENVFYEYDTYRASINCFRAGGIMRPLESATVRQASELWLKREMGWR